MTALHIDMESRSTCDLRKRGSHIYARDPSTEILCMAYAFDDEPVQLWKPGEELPTRIGDHVMAGLPIYAHNAAGFELPMWNNVGVRRHGWPSLIARVMRCTMAMAYAMALPGSLDDAAAAVGLQHRKDAKGSRIMLQLCKPRRMEDNKPVWWDDPEKYEALYAYCKQDVETERALHHRLLELSPEEQELWVLDQNINEYGIRVDLTSIDRAMELVGAETKRLNQAMQAVTKGAVATCTATGQLTDWLRWRGVETAGVAKADVTALLSAELPDDVRKALTLRQEAAKSSTAKLKKMRDTAGHFDRVRGTLQFHGAGTGRWAARGMQMQNLPRPSLLKDQRHVEDAIAHFDDLDYLDVFYGSPLQVISDCLRGMIVADRGRELVCCDFSNIEGRVLAWLAGEKWKLDAYQAYDDGTGTDTYLLAAARIFRCSVEEAAQHRQVGKVAELACGYQGGVGAFQSMAKLYGIVVEDEHADAIKVKWREAHPAIVQFWKDLEYAAVRAVREGGKQTARGIAFKKSGSFLWCRLPSGRTLCYPYPEVRAKEMPWSTPDRKDYRPSLSYMSVNGVTRKWERTDTYGGSLAENVTQAVARDLLAHALKNVARAGFQTVMHVHDEIVVEAPLRALTVDNLATLMTDKPQWASGLPIAATGWHGQRYRKD